VRIKTTLLIAIVLSATTTAVTAQTNTQTVPIDPKVAGLVKEARSAERLHQYDVQIQSLSAALQMKPEMKTASAIHSWRAHAYYKKGDLAKAMSDATESIRLNPRHFGGYLNRGIIYRRTGNLDQAISDYNTAIRLNPNFARTYYDRAIAYSLKGDYNAAIRDSTEAIHRQDPTMQADFYYNRAAFYQALGTLDKAMADYNEAIRIAPEDFRSYCGRASAFQDMGQLDKARADYDQVTRLNAADASDYKTRGTARFARGNYPSAASDFEKATRLSPSDYDALHSLAWFQATCPEDSLRNGKEALQKSLRACELSRWQDSGAVDTLAAAYAELGDFDNAIKYETQAINMKGVYAFKRNRMQKRLELYRQHKPYREESKFKER
jgi:tetratricopeptide (TPR) repeat protein